MDDTTRMGSVQGRSLRKVIWWGLGVILLIAGVGYGVWWWKFRDTLHYVTARVSRGDIRRSINMTGALNPVVTAQVGSYVSGNIKSWSCDYNTEVKIGQQCALIDPLPFQVIVDEDVADVNTSKAQLVKDKAALVNAKLVYERDKKLTEQGIVTQETLDSDKSTFDQDVATIDLDVATIASKVAALHAAQVNLDYTKIVSPVNGTVITRYIDVGYTVVSSLQSSTLFLIGKDMRSMQVDTNVSEADVGEVHDGQKANFTVQAYPNRTFEATVRQVRKGPITVQNVVTYDVVLDVDNKDLALLPGMTSDTHIITAERKNVLRVPLPATRFVPEGFARSGRGGPGGEGSGPGRGFGAGAGDGSSGTGRPGGAGAGGRSGGGEDQESGDTPAQGAAGRGGPGATDDGLPGSGGSGGTGNTAGGAPGVGGTGGANGSASANGAASNTTGGAPGVGGTGGANGSASASGAAGAAPGASGTAGQTDNNQQRRHRWDHQHGNAQAGTPNTGAAAGVGTGAGAGPKLARADTGNAQGTPGQSAHDQPGRDQATRGNGGAPGARRARGPRAMARIWVLRNGKLTPVMVRTGLDDGTLIEVWSDDLKEGDEVVVNAVRPNAPRPTPGSDRPQGAQGQPNPGRGGGGAGTNFRL
jgi:HlyD family secretion protein